MTETYGQRRAPANDNPLWSWRGRCEACNADMGPLRDARHCRDCLTGERAAASSQEDALWAMLLETREIPPLADPGPAAGTPRW